jgi:hypothetical protein
VDVETPETVLIDQDGETPLERAIASLPAIAPRDAQLPRDRRGDRVSIGTVMSRLARARGRIISIMTELGAQRS